MFESAEMTRGLSGLAGKGLVRHDQVYQGPLRHRRWSFGEPRLCIVVPCGAGNVQVNPRSISRKLANKPRASDTAATFAASDILYVREAAFDEFAILVIHRHLPHFFARGFGGSEQFIGESLVRAE